MTKGAARWILGTALLIVVVRATPTVEGMRSLMFGGLYLLCAVCAVSLSLSIAEKTLIDLAAKWRARSFDPCGVMDFSGRPCMLPDTHADREHATAWQPTEADEAIEQRHRFDDVASEGRDERRYARGQLKRVTRTGAVAEPAR